MRQKLYPITMPALLTGIALFFFAACSRPVSLNDGEPLSADGGPVLLTEDGYLTISRQWSAGDRLRLHFDMPVRLVRAEADD